LNYTRLGMPGLNAWAEGTAAWRQERNSKPVFKGQQMSPKARPQAPCCKL